MTARESSFGGPEELFAGKRKKGLTKALCCHIIVLLVRADWRDGRVVYGAGLENQ